ncbi:MAG: cyclic-di-AMP receptor [Chloroflexota bacterium]
MPIDRLMTAVIQVQDVEPAMTALEQGGFMVTHLASSGGFLGSRNETLLIGLSAGQEAQVIEVLAETCRRRVEYVATPLEGAPFHLPLTTPVTVGGATIFTMPVERYEVIS